MTAIDRSNELLKHSKHQLKTVIDTQIVTYFHNTCLYIQKMKKYKCIYKVENIY